MTDVQVTKDKLLHDFNQVVDDTEQLLKSMTSAGGEKAQSVRSGIEQNLKVAKQRLGEIQGSALERTRAVARTTDQYVHANPWQSIGIVAALSAIVGMVVGLLLNRR